MKTQLRPLKAFKCFQNNGPEYWIVADKAFKGTTLASCDTEESALLIVRAVNVHEELLQVVKDLRYRSFDVTFKGWDFKKLEHIIAKAEGKVA